MIQFRNVFLVVVVAVISYHYFPADWRHHLGRQSHNEKMSWAWHDDDKLFKTYIFHMDKSVMPSQFSDHGEWYETTVRLVSNSADILYVYDEVMHGFAATVPVEEIKLLKQQHGVVSVHEETVYQLHTTRTPEFLGLERADVIDLESKSAGNVIVGVIDTGIWPGRSLDDTGFAPIPSKWQGMCETGKDFPASTCNRKLVGARYFLRAYEAWLKENGRTLDENVESRSPVDDNGHGTHCATIAVGSAVTNANLFGYASGTAHGMAPHARLAVYKVCWAGGCFGADVLQAFETAITDGVDILSASIGLSPRAPPFQDDFYALAAFRAISQGIFVAFSAGNDGPTPGDISNVAPWQVVVGASSLDRDFPGYVTLGTGIQFSGVSLWSSEEPIPVSMVPLVLAGTISPPNSSLCYPGSLPPVIVTGKIVVCEIGGFNIRDVEKGLAVKAAGGVGMILANTVDRLRVLEVDSQVIPTVVVDKTAHDAIKSYILSTQNAVALLTFQGTITGVQPSPIVAQFSARGPNPFTPYLLKPDIIAPGVNILAGWTGKASPTGLPYDPRRVEFNILSGTSMACPHVSGIAVLFKVAYPQWSPAAIQSALMTNAYNMYSDGGLLLDVVTGRPATPFDVGAGHVNPVPALINPGLVYDASPEDYLGFLCALNYSSDFVKLYSGGSFTCDQGKTYRPEDLNYPSFAVPFATASAQTILKYTRTLTNVGPAATYRVSTWSSTDDVRISVEPEVLTFNVNDVKEYTVTFYATSRPQGTISSGRLAWLSDQSHQVRSPIAFSWT